MFNPLKYLILVFSLFLGAEGGLAQTALPSFPGAEGFGRNTTGGRGGRVIYVTHLNDDNNPGSLRYAVSQPGPRIILFKVSGTILLKSELKITRDSVTIAGQTAPGDGITLRDFNVLLDADNVIIRFIRFRMGDVTNQENDAIWGRERKNIMIDHCTMSWSTDECASFYDNENFTLQWCLLSESLRNSVHEKVTHGYGGIWGGRKASFHHNLLAHHDSRNPRFCGSRYSNKPDLEMVDFRNNVIFNWGSNTVYGGEGGKYNIIHNYYKAGPASSNRSRILQPMADDGKNAQPAGTFGTYFITGNHVSESAANTSNNWLGVSLHSSFVTYAPGIALTQLKSENESGNPEVTTHSALTAFGKVAEFAGACLVRDTIDKRIVREVNTGVVTFSNGGNGSKNGLIDTQSAVGGWPLLQSLPAPADSDNDGMPDSWEDARGLDKNSPADAQLTTVDGKYPNIEAYINSLVSVLTENQLRDGISTAAGTLPLLREPLKISYDSRSANLKIFHTSEITRIDLFSVTGTLIRTEGVKNKEATLNLSEERTGVYIVRIRDAKQKFHSGKFIKY